MVYDQGLEQRLQAPLFSGEEACDWMIPQRVHFFLSPVGTVLQTSCTAQPTIFDDLPQKIVFGENELGSEAGAKRSPAIVNASS